MRRFLWIFVIGALTHLALAHLSDVQAGTFNFTEIQRLRDTHDPSYDRVIESMAEAIAFSTTQYENRTKLPGRFKFFFEGGAQVTSVNDGLLHVVMTNLHCPASFQTVQFRGGVGLPYGFTIMGGLSQTFSEIKFGSLNANISYQLLDLASVVYTDLVPSVSINLGASRTYNIPATLNISGETSIGAYHRSSLMQFAYVFQTNYINIQIPKSTENKFLFRHGIISHVPLYKGLYMRTELFLPALAATLAMGYQF